jgi:hypothetical protein
MTVESSSKKDTPAASPKLDDSKPAVVIPPLEASALHLERLLGADVTNPAKVVRRWLGTSSGASADATLHDIQAAAAKLLDSSSLLAEITACTLADDAAMQVDNDEPINAQPRQVVLNVAAREVESWFMSLMVRLLWKEKKYKEAFELTQKGIDRLEQHLEEASLKVTSVSSSASLFPLMARLYRFRTLLAEAMQDNALLAALRVDMAEAHTRASVRRDVDTQATLLNSMLRDLLNNAQGTVLYLNCAFAERMKRFVLDLVLSSMFAHARVHSFLTQSNKRRIS